jgi:hypothetical protein
MEELPPDCGSVFVYSGRLGALNGSQATNRSVTGVGGSHRESSLLPISRPGVIYDSQLHGYALFFIAVRIRVNIVENTLARSIHCVQCQLERFKQEARQVG